MTSAGAGVGAQPAGSALPPGDGTPATTSLFDGPDVTGFLGGRSGTVTAGVEDLDSGQIWLYHPEQRQVEASVIKVDILATLLAALERAGRRLTPVEAQLSAAMIEQSDNDATDSLWQELYAGSSVAVFNQDLSLRQTTLGTGSEWGMTTTTVADQLTLLRDLVAGTSLLAPLDARYVLGLMRNVDPSDAWGVSSGVAPGASVALKNGWLPLQDGTWQVNSIGSVSGAGHRYLMAVLTTEDPDEQYGIDTINGLAARLWMALADAGG